MAVRDGWKVWGGGRHGEGERVAMRLGGPVFGNFEDPEEWARAAVSQGWRAVYSPDLAGKDSETIEQFARSADRHGLVIAEVGAWSNPLSPDPEEAKKALAHCRRQLELADRIGARCCVNIAGSRGSKWDGPSPLDLTPDTFDRIVETTRALIDDVRPTRTYWTLETMPWMFPHSPETYLDLLRAVDRERFAVHFDPVNMINSPILYFTNADFVRRSIELLGPWIRSVHVKDIRLSDNLTVHLDEVAPGQGGMDFVSMLRALSGLDPDLPLMLEHLRTEDEYRVAGDHMREVAAGSGWGL